MSVLAWSWITGQDTTNNFNFISLLQISTSVREILSYAEEAFAKTPREVIAVNVLLVISFPPTSQRV